MLLDGGRLVTDAGLVHLRGDHFQQIKRVIDPSGSKALDLLSCTAVLARAFCGDRGGVARGDGTWACGLRLGRGFFRACLWWGFLRGGRCLFLGQQSSVLCLAKEFCLALLFPILLAFGGFFTFRPLGRLCSFLEKRICNPI